MNSMKAAIMKRRMKNMGDMECDPEMMDGEESQESKEEQEQTKAAGLAPERESEESTEPVGEAEMELTEGEEPGEESIQGEGMGLENKIGGTGKMSEEEMLKMAEMLYEKDHAGKPSILGKANDRMKMMLSKRGV